MENSGEEKTYHKPLPKNGFGPPHLWYVPPPPVCPRPVIFFRGNGHRPDQPHALSEASKTGLGAGFPPKNFKISRSWIPDTPQFVRAARLQNEVGTNDFLWGTNFLTKNAPKVFSKFWPSGPEETSWCRGAKIAARQFLPLNCLSITLTAGIILKEEKWPLLWGRDSLGGILGDTLGEGNCESKNVSRQWGDIFAARHQDVSQGPLGSHHLWVRKHPAKFLPNFPPFFPAKLGKAPDTLKFLRQVMRAILSVRPKCSHRCASLKETPLKPVQILKHITKNSAEQTSMRTKWFKTYRDLNRSDASPRWAQKSADDHN